MSQGRRVVSPIGDGGGRCRQRDGLYFPSPVVGRPAVGELSDIQALYILIPLCSGSDGLSEIGVPEGIPQVLMIWGSANLPPDVIENISIGKGKTHCGKDTHPLPVSRAIWGFCRNAPPL